MKFSNTTAYAPHFLRRLAVWCRAEIGLPAAQLRAVDFRNRRDKWVCGRADWSGRILVRIGRAPDAPLAWTHRTIKVECRDRMAAIVFVTAHEIQHIKNYRDGSHAQLTADRDMEPHCDRAGNRVMKAFEERREELLAEWNAAPERAAAALAPDPIAKRAAKAATDLARWERKLKLAKGKVAKYRARVKYYARKDGAT